jgi:hypothetical protein
MSLCWSSAPFRPSFRELEKLLKSLKASLTTDRSNMKRLSSKESYVNHSPRGGTDQMAYFSDTRGRTSIILSDTAEVLAEVEMQVTTGRGDVTEKQKREEKDSDNEV